MSGDRRYSVWMAAAQSGDQQAYRRLLEALQPLLLRFVRRRVGSDAAAEDVCQEILLTLHRVRRTYEPHRPFEPWLYSIARSRIVDHLRRERRIGVVEVMLDTLPEVGTSGAEMSPDSALDVLDRLPAAQRDAFMMLKVEGLSTEEAAARAGVSVSALKVRAHRAYKALKRALGGDSS